MTSLVRYIREEYHYVSSAFPTPSPSSAAAIQRNMPAHIKFKKLRDRNCNLTLERSCTMYTVPRGRHTLTDQQRCTCLVSCINAAGFTLTELLALLRPRPRPELHESVRPTCTHTHTHTPQRSICTLYLSNANATHRHLTFAFQQSSAFPIELNWAPTLTGQIQGLPTDFQGLVW